MVGTLKPYLLLKESNFLHSHVAGIQNFLLQAWNPTRALMLILRKPPGGISTTLFWNEGVHQFCWNILDVSWQLDGQSGYLFISDIILQCHERACRLDLCSWRIFFIFTVWTPNVILRILATVRKSFGKKGVAFINQHLVQHQSICFVSNTAWAYQVLYQWQRQFTVAPRITLGSPYNVNIYL